MSEEKEKIQKEIVDGLPSPCHGLLTLAPRVGKTKIALDIIRRDKPKKILWVTPNTKLRDEDIPAEFKLWKMMTFLRKTNIICYASLSDMTGNYSTVILDEYQDLTENNAKPLLDGRITYDNIIGLSGTSPKHKEKLELYKQLKLETLITMTIDEAVEKRLIAPYDITVVECRLNATDKYLQGGKAGSYFMQDEASRYKYLTRLINAKLFSGQQVPAYLFLNRMRFIYNLRSKNDFAKKLISKLPGRTLVFTGGIQQAEDICKYTYHSKTDDTDLKKFLADEINTLACVNAGGVGFTYRNVDNFVIVQVNSDKKGDATQKIARSLVLQEGYKANIYIICTIDTVDETWKNKALEGFASANVKHVSSKNYE